MILKIFKIFYISFMLVLSWKAFFSFESTGEIYEILFAQLFLLFSIILILDKYVDSIKIKYEIFILKFISLDMIFVTSFMFIKEFKKFIVNLEFLYFPILFFLSVVIYLTFKLFINSEGIIKWRRGEHI